MNIMAQSKATFLIERMIELMSYAVRHNEPGYSSMIELTLMEWVRDAIRQDVYEDCDITPEDLIVTNMGDLNTRLEKRCLKLGVKFNWMPYFTSVQAHLKYPAREMVTLGKQLERTEAGHPVTPKEQRYQGVGIDFRIVEIGAEDGLEGLLTIPAVEQCALNLEKVRTLYAVKGSWYPFEVYQEPFQFVIEEDGSVFTPVENYPQSLLEDATASLIALATKLYSLTKLENE